MKITLRLFLSAATIIAISTHCKREEKTITIGIVSPTDFTEEDVEIYKVYLYKEENGSDKILNSFTIQKKDNFAINVDNIPEKIKISLKGFNKKNRVIAQAESDYFSSNENIKILLGNVNNFQEVSFLPELPSLPSVLYSKKNEKIFIIGGLYSGNATGTVYIISLKTLNWVEKNITIPRWDFSPIELPNGDIIIAGGNNGKTSIPDVEILKENGFSEIVGKLSTPRQNYQAFLWEDFVIFIGGKTITEYNNSLSESALSTCEFYNLKDKRFSGEFRCMPSPRFNFQMEIIEKGTILSKILIIGGKDEKGNTLPIGKIRLYNRFDYIDTVFSEIKMKKPRYGHRVFKIEDKVYITGGIDSQGNVLQDTEILYPDENSTVSGPSLNTPRTDFCISSYEVVPGLEYFIVYGGYSDTEKKSYSDDVEIFEQSDFKRVNNYETGIRIKMKNPLSSFFCQTVLNIYLYNFGGDKTTRPSVFIPNYIGLDFF